MGRQSMMPQNNKETDLSEPKSAIDIKNLNIELYKTNNNPVEFESNDDTNKNKTINQFRSVDFFRKSNAKVENIKVTKEIIKEKLLIKFKNTGAKEETEKNQIQELENGLFQGDEIDHETLMEIKKKNPDKYEQIRRAVLETKRSRGNLSTRSNKQQPDTKTSKLLNATKNNDNRKISKTSESSQIRGQIIPKLNIKEA